MKNLTYFIIGYSAIVSTLALYFAFFKKTDTNSEITVERINIVEPDGSLKMVLSNSQKQHAGIINGQPLPDRERPAGLIFFNSLGDECGGLVYDGNKEEAGFVLSVDQFRNDQVMQLQYLENVTDKERKYGLQLWGYKKEDSYEERNDGFERMDKLATIEEKDSLLNKMKNDKILMEDRLFIGRHFSQDVGLFIKDDFGHPRIKIYVDADNEPKIEIFDELGLLIKTLN